MNHDMRAAILAKLDSLIAARPAVNVPETHSVHGDMAADCMGWLSSAGHVVAMVLPTGDEPCRRFVMKIIESAVQEPLYCHVHASHVAGILKQLRGDIATGLLFNVEDRVSAETFDDLLDHADAYLADGRHQPAGVLAGVVFEDTVRRLCEKHGIEQRDRELDSILSALKSANVITKLEQKEGITSAEVRAKATHAQWDAFNGDQVRAVINFARRLIREKLGR